jgi:hypothetical protein
MTRNTDTRPHFIAWYRDVFGFSDRVATALYDDQLFKDALTLLPSLVTARTVSVTLFAVIPAYQLPSWL